MKNKPRFLFPKNMEHKFCKFLFNDDNSSYYLCNVYEDHWVIDRIFNNGAAFLHLPSKDGKGSFYKKEYLMNEKAYDKAFELSKKYMNLA